MQLTLILCDKNSSINIYLTLMNNQVNLLLVFYVHQCHPVVVFLVGVSVVGVRRGYSNYGRNGLHGRRRS